MATHYIDPVNGSDATGDDTNINTPRQTWSSLSSFTSGDTYLQKRGTSINNAAGRHGQLDDTVGVTLGSYGVGPRPVMSGYTTLGAGDSADWALTGTANVWEYTGVTTNFWNPLVLIGFNDLHSTGIRKKWVSESGGVLQFDGPEAPAADGEWDTWDGSASNNTRLYIYATSNPATYYSNLYFSESRYPCFQVRRADLMEIKDLRFRYCSNAVKASEAGGTPILTSGSIHMHDCEIAYAGGNAVSMMSAANTFWWDGCVIERNYIHHCGSAAFFGLDYAKNCHIRYNIVHDVCLSHSNGGIYIGDDFSPAGEPNRVYRNEVYRVEMGHYWPVDGGAIMLDSGAGNMLVYNNYVHHTEQAFHDNSGLGNTYYGNVAHDCDVAMLFGDSSGALQIDHKIFSNTFINCAGDTIGDGSRPQLRVIHLDSHASDTSPRWEIRNNIITGTAATLTSGINMTQDVETNGIIDESNNLIYNVQWAATRDMGSEDKSSTLDASTLLVSPQLDADFAPHLSSPCIGAGAPVLSSLDYYGKPSKGVGYDIGAVWGSSSNPLSITGETDEYGDLIYPDGLPQTASYNADGSLDYVEVLYGSIAWRKTMAYSGSNVTTITATCGTLTWEKTFTYNSDNSVATETKWVKQ